MSEFIAGLSATIFMALIAAAVLYTAAFVVGAGLSAGWAS